MLIVSECERACKHFTLIAGLVFYCKCCRAGGGQRSTENMRCVEMNTRSQWGPCFLSNVFSVAKQLKASLLARTALFWLWCNPPGLPSWRLSDGQPTPVRGTKAHVHMRAGWSINRHMWTHAFERTCTGIHISFKLNLSWQRENTTMLLQDKAWPVCGSYLTNLTIMINLDEWQNLYSEVRWSC